MGTTKHRNATTGSYQQLKEQIRTGDLFFCVGEYTVSKLIRRFSDSDFSHIGILYKLNDRIFLMESVEDDGVRMVPLYHYVYDYENSGQKYNGQLYLARHSQFPANPDQVKGIIEHGWDLLNKNYDKEELARVMWRVATGEGRNHPNDEYICSEFVEACFERANLLFDSDRGFVYPEHIAANQNVNFLNEIIQ